MLLANLPILSIKDIQNIASKIKKKGKYSSLPTADCLQPNEDGWWELESSESLVSWVGTASPHDLVGFIKEVLLNLRGEELQSFKSTFTFEARLKLLHPENAVSRPRPVPAEVGWWTAYSKAQIVSMDCEMVSNIIGYRTKKGKATPRCVNKAATVSVSSYEGAIIYKRTVYHDPKTVYLTDVAKQKTGFSVNDFINGIPIETIRVELTELFNGKLIIMIGSSSDFEALGLEKGKFDVFDLHEYFVKDTGKIGLRSLVMHYFKVDIQKGAHSADVDSIFTMKLFTNVYIVEKRQNRAEVNNRGTTKMFNEIKTIK
ncbi:unnamed protein product [Orchesella dallaii]|uniref:Exonuclease domain-containing protein n=1 Tax=Orchesella dallaii TaxID=48710 RepID=A0ABP1QY01_9HEXA